MYICVSMYRYVYVCIDACTYGGMFVYVYVRAYVYEHAGILKGNSILLN